MPSEKKFKILLVYLRTMNNANDIKSNAARKITNELVEVDAKLHDRLT